MYIAEDLTVEQREMKRKLLEKVSDLRKTYPDDKITLRDGKKIFINGKEWEDNTAAEDPSKSS